MACTPLTLPVMAASSSEKTSMFSLPSGAVRVFEPHAVAQTRLLAHVRLAYDDGGGVAVIALGVGGDRFHEKLSLALHLECVAEGDAEDVRRVP